MEDILSALATIKVPGRSEVVDINKSFAVIIDYAHTPASLEAIIINTKKYIKGRVITVFGCGGNRSKERRYDMGEISGRLADFTIVTEDNSRYEDINDIMNDIEIGLKKTSGKYIKIPSRKDAIKYVSKKNNVSKNILYSMYEENKKWK